MATSGVVDGLLDFAAEETSTLSEWIRESKCICIELERGVNTRGKRAIVTQRVH